MRFGHRDAGSPDSERQDCAVRAWALAFDMAYADAHAVLKGAGRVDSEGAKWVTIQRAARAAGARLIPVRAHYATGGGRWARETVATWVARHQTGRWILYTLDHAMALIDGVVYDMRGSKQVRSTLRWVQECPVLIAGQNVNNPLPPVDKPAKRRTTKRVEA